MINKSAAFRHTLTMSKRKTAKAFRDYHSSDYGNEEEEEDYGPEYEDDEDDFGGDGLKKQNRAANHPDSEDNSDSKSDGARSKPKKRAANREESDDA